MNDNRNAGVSLRRILNDIAKAKRAKDEALLNSSFAALGEECSRLFEPYVQYRLSQFGESQFSRQIALDTAEDCFSEMMFRTFKKIDQFRGSTDGEAYAWLKKILANLISSEQRKAERRYSRWTRFFRIVPKNARAFMETKPCGDGTA